MKKWLIALLVGALVISPCWARESGSKKTSPAVKAVKKNAPRPTAKPAPPPERQDPYKAFIVVEAQTGRMLEGENLHQALAPASITKLMLAAIVLDGLEAGRFTLEDAVTVSPEAQSMGGSQVFLRAGETFTLEEMMKAVMVASANDAAYAVAEFAAGSREAFVDLMNQKAEKLGMTDSRFYSMHGLPPSAGQNPDLTSCHDLALLARELLNRPKVLEWTALNTAPFRNDTLVMQNHNRLMNRFSGMDGLKTGYYRDAGYSLVATARRNNLRLITVVMGSPSYKIRDSIAEEKLKKHFALLELATVVKKGEPVEKQVALPDGKQKSLKPVAAADFVYPVARDKKKLLTTDIDLPDQAKGEIKEGQRLGRIVIRLDKDVVGTVDLVSPVHVPKAGFFSRFFE